MQRELILKQFNDIEKAKELLSASVDKFVPYDIDKYYTPDELEYYDSLAFRFEKCVELTINFFRSLELFLYAKQSDTLRDRLLKMQKTNVIADIDFWMEARLLRNKISHAYLPEEIKDIYREIYHRSKEIFKTIDKIKNYMSK